MFSRPQKHPKAQREKIRGLQHLQSKRPRADLVSLIALAQFKQPVEKQTACQLIGLIPWLVAQGGKLKSTEQRIWDTGLKTNTHP